MILVTTGVYQTTLIDEPLPQEVVVIESPAMLIEQEIQRIKEESPALFS